MDVTTWLLDVLERLDGRSPWVLFLGAVLYCCATVLMLPGSGLTIACGALFGIVRGTLVVSLGSTAGATLAFLIARTLGRAGVARWAQKFPRWQALDSAIGIGGWKLVVLLRLSPVIPFNLQNYFLGLTPIGLVPYVVASWIAMLPGTLLYVYIGAVAKAVLLENRQRTWAEWAFFITGFIATVLAVIYVGRLARASYQRLQHVSESDAKQ